MSPSLVGPSFSWHSLPPLFPLQPRDDLPKLTTPTFIGIVIAITGNILISLALNLQKLAHKRVEDESRKRQCNGGLIGKGRRNGDRDQGNAGHTPADGPARYGHEQEHISTPTSGGNFQLAAVTATETESLIPFPITTSQNAGYGARGSSINRFSSESPRVPSTPRNTCGFASRFVPRCSPRSRNALSDTGDTPDAAALLPTDVILAGDSAQFVARRRDGKLSVIEEGNETDYLKSKLWWLGFLLMNVGEVGNFVSYAWAPASVVAPLGTFSLMANCFFAPLLLRERFRKRDMLGILIAIIGAVTVVIASNSSDTRLDPDTLLRAISQKAFIIYSCIYVAGAVVLAGLSQGNVGRQWVFVDVGLCALFGGFTVLSTKAISTLLTMEWIEMFSKWITYPVLAVLVLTGVGQIRYLNRALMRFDSKVVIPVQFVLFTLSAIIGSAILYGDFKKAKFHQVVTFLYGCAATFLGVFIIAWAPSSQHRDSESAELEDADATDALSTLTVDERRFLGSIGRRRRATLTIPSRTRDSSLPRSPHKVPSIIGLSPAQHLLLVHTPPPEAPISSLAENLTNRRRTTSWEDMHEGLIRSSPHENNIAQRLRDSSGFHAGSLDQRSYR